MQNNRRYFRIGLLTVAAFLLIIGMVFFLGLAEEFAPRIRFATVFTESVQGLSKGSPVKFKGVAIGQVDKISILPQQKIIRVDMSIDPVPFTGFADEKEQQNNFQKLRNFFLQERQAGLVCRLDLAGITGMRYIEMDYVTDGKQRKQALPEINEPGVIYFASVPGTFSNIVDSVAVSLDKIAQVDLHKISAGLDNNLEAINAILRDPALRNTIDRLERTAGNIEQISRDISENMTGEELKKVVKGVNDNLASMNKLTNEFYEKLDQIHVAELDKQLTDTLQKSRELMQDLSNGSVDAIQTLRQINVFLDNINELIDYLKQDPSSLVRGKAAKPVVFDKQ